MDSLRRAQEDATESIENKLIAVLGTSAAICLLVIGLLRDDHALLIAGAVAAYAGGAGILLSILPYEEDRSTGSLLLLSALFAAILYMGVRWDNRAMIITGAVVLILPAALLLLGKVIQSKASSKRSSMMTLAISTPPSAPLAPRESTW